MEWRAVVLFAKRSVEPENTKPFQTLLYSHQVDLIYLEDLQQTASVSMGIALIQLIIADFNQAIGQAQTLLSQARSQLFSLLSTAVVVELIETIIVYKFPQLSREEIEQMLGLSDIRQTRVYQEALQEGRQEGRQEGEINLVLRLLTKRVGPITPNVEAQIRGLSLPQLESLGEALLDFADLADLTTWLQSMP